MVIFASFKKYIRKALHGVMTVGLALSTIGAGNLPAYRLAVPVLLESPSGRLSAPPGRCLTQAVRITLASEQISFCAPTSQPFNVVEDSASDASVDYAGLDQMDGYGIVNVKATAPGNTPGTGRPVFTSDGVVAYRQAVWKIESSKTDRTVTNGPPGLFWGETVPGIQMDVSLPMSAVNLQVRSIEWYVAHNSRFWSFIITWDTEMQNASEWEAASRNISVQKPDSENLADTALDLGKAFLESKAESNISSLEAPVDVGVPSWWKGICDDTNYYAHTAPQTHSFVLKDSHDVPATWHGLSACGPVGGPDYAVLFPGASSGEYEFECVELVMRFLYLKWRIMPWPGNANQIKNSPPSSMVFYPNDGSRGIVSGDIITENGDGSIPNDVGHTVIVTGTSGLDGTGTGTINILEQNASTAGQRSLTVINWQVQRDAWTWGSTIQGWLHVKGNQEDGNPDPVFAPGTGPDGRVNAIAIKPSGKILIAGDFSNYNGTAINQIARLNIDGSLDTAFSPTAGVTTADGSSPHVLTLAVYPNGVYQGWALIGGHFDSYNGTPRNYIARLKSDGSLDKTFTPPPEVNADIDKIVIQADGKILIGGDGILYRLNSKGSLDSDFNGTMDKDVHDIAVQASDGRIVIGGDFSKVDDSSRAGIARLNSDGTLDTSFDPGTGTEGNAVASIALQADGKMLIGGTFITYDGTSRNKVARLNSNGSLDLTFDPGTGFSGSSDSVQAIVTQPDGRILVGGNFSSFNGTPLNHIGRLNFDGSLDSSFAASTDNLVQALVLQPDEKMIIGGDFTNHVARLLNHIGSCYTLIPLVTPVAGGSVTVNPAPNCPFNKYLSGTLAQLTAVLNPDYWLVNWSGDASGSANPLNLTMDGNKSVTATLMGSPGHFNKVAPVNGATDVPAGPGLSWETSDGASSYEYCLFTANSTDCNLNIPSRWISTGLNTNVTLSNLLPSVTYFWQVRARNLVDTTDATGGWSSFTRNGIPAVPVTVSPNGMILDTLPSYVWNGSNGATTYHLTVYLMGTTTTVIDDTVDGSACSGGVCTYHPLLVLDPGDYEYRVSATATGTSDFSPWRTFSVGIKLFLPLIISSGT